MASNRRFAAHTSGRDGRQGAPRIPAGMDRDRDREREGASRRRAILRGGCGGGPPRRGRRLLHRLLRLCRLLRRAVASDRGDDRGVVGRHAGLRQAQERRSLGKSNFVFSIKDSTTSLSIF